MYSKTQIKSSNKDQMLPHDSMFSFAPRFSEGSPINEKNHLEIQMRHTAPNNHFCNLSKEQDDEDKEIEIVRVGL